MIRPKTSAADLRCAAFVGNSAVQGANKDADGFDDGEEKTAVEGGRALRKAGGVCFRRQAHIFQLCQVLQGGFPFQSSVAKKLNATSVLVFFFFFFLQP